jgi:hypothetical protein
VRAKSPAFNKFIISPSRIGLTLILIICSRFLKSSLLDHYLSATFDTRVISDENATDLLRFNFKLF